MIGMGFAIACTDQARMNAFAAKTSRAVVVSKN